MKKLPLRSLRSVVLAMLLGTLCFSSGAQVIVWGYNYGNVLYVPPSATNVVALAAGDEHCLALRADGTVVAWGSNYLGQTNVPSDLTNAVSVAAGSTHSLALRSDGTVALWGHVLGTAFGSTLPQEATNIVALGLGPGAQHVLALRSDGSLLDWGNSDSGVNIIPSAALHVVAVAAGSLHGLALRSDGNVVAWGGTDTSVLNVPASATNIVAIATGWYGNAALRADGTVLTWGRIWSPSSTYAFNGAVDMACPIDSLDSGSLLALRRDGTVLQYTEPGPSYATNLAAIAAGSAMALGVVGNGPPMFTGLPVNRTVRPGMTAYFRMTAFGALPISYQWSCNGTNVPGATNSVLIQTNVQPEQAGNSYSLTATNAFGAATNGPIRLYTVPLEIAIQPPSLTALVATNVTLNAQAFGEGSFAYQWQLNGTNIDGATNAALFLSYIQPRQSGVYSVTASNFYGAVTSSGAALSVVPVLLTSQPQSQTVLVGTNVNFTVAASGQQPLAYQWQRDDTNLLGATDASLSLTNVQFGHAGTYSVVVGSLYGAVASAGAVLSVAPLLITSQPSAQTVPAGTNVTFGVAATGQTPFSYQWLWNGTNMDSATNASLVLTNVQCAQTGSYWAVITNMYGAVTSSAALLSVIPQLITTQPQPQIVLAGSNVTFSVVAAAQDPIACQWLLNGTNLTDATNASLLLTNVQFNQAGAYSVVVSNSYGAVSSLGAPLAVIPLLVSSQPLNQTVIPGANATFSVTASSLVPLSYQWLCDGTNVPYATNASLVVTNVQMNQGGTYFVVVSNSYGSMTSWGAALSVVPLLITVQPQDLTVQAGGSAFFVVSANGKATLRYQWRVDGTDLSGRTQQSLLLSGIQMSNAGTYSVVVTNGYGLVTSTGAVLTVTPLWITSQPQSVTALEGDTATLSVAAGGQQPISYQWYCNGIGLTNATNTSLVLTILQLTNAGTYFAIASDPYATIPSSTAQLVVNPIPIPPPEFESISQTTGVVSLTWSATTGLVYRLQYSSDLSSSNWSNVGSTITATNDTASGSDTNGTEPRRFYRLLVTP